MRPTANERSSPRRELPLRQTEGFVRSLIALMQLDLTVPGHTTHHEDQWVSLANEAVSVAYAAHRDLSLGFAASTSAGNSAGSDMQKVR